MFRISGVAPDLGLGVGVSPIGIPTEVVISHVGEIMIMRLCVRPSLTRDPVNSGVCFSHIVMTFCKPVLAANLPLFLLSSFWLRADICNTFAKDEEWQEHSRKGPIHVVFILLLLCVVLFINVWKDLMAIYVAYSPTLFWLAGVALRHNCRVNE